MKGKRFMNPVILDVVLMSQGEDQDILLFKFPDDRDFSINLNSDSCQKELKEVFSNLLKIIIEKDISLSLSIQEGYDRILYIDVCKEYIQDLQKELDVVKERIRKELET